MNISFKVNVKSKGKKTPNIQENLGIMTRKDPYE